MNTETIDPFDGLVTLGVQPGQRLVLVNGPPRSGKDTVGQLIEEFAQGVYVTKMAKILKERTHALYGMPGLPHDYFEANKEEAMKCFMWKSPRQAYIAVSETFFKPNHGLSVFGDLLLEEIKEQATNDSMVVVTDSGFAAEAWPLLDFYGTKNVLLIRLHRDGTSFEGDSRSYIDLPYVETLDLYNNGTKEDLALAMAPALGLSIGFRVEVQLPAFGNTLDWFQQGAARENLPAALVAVEALRRGNYGQRAMRIVVGKDRVVRLVMPGDAPVVEFGT